MFSFLKDTFLYVHTFVYLFIVIFQLTDKSAMKDRRIAIYLGSHKATSQVKMNHAYTNKIESIIFKTGHNKTEVARQLLMHSFQTNNVCELKEKIVYAANMVNDTAITEMGFKRRVAVVCKKAIKIAIDNGYLL
jgi:hypothetical protein